MTYKDILDIASSWAAIFTAAIALFAYCVYRYERRRKRLLVEQYSKAERDAGANKGQRSLTHLVANLGMTETEILDCAFRSHHIGRVVTKDEKGMAKGLLLEYRDRKSN